MTEAATIVFRRWRPFPFGGPQHSVDQTGQVGLVQCPASLHGFVQYRVGGLFAVTQLEQGHQHQVVNDPVRLAQGLFQALVQLALKSVKPAAGAITDSLQLWPLFRW